MDVLFEAGDEQRHHGTGQGSTLHVHGCSGGPSDIKAELLGRDQPWVSPEVKSGFAPLRVSSAQEGDLVRVTAWGVAVSGQLPPTSAKEPLPPSAAWMQLTTRMIWDGGWKITSAHSEYGPMPFSAQFPASADEVYDQLFDPASRPAF